MPAHVWKSGDSLGQYTLIRLVGHGGYGQVWRADDTLNPDADVAVKIFVTPWDTGDMTLDEESLDENEDARRRFRREAQFLRDTERRTRRRFGREHHIVRVSALVEDNDHNYLVMPYIQGTNLKQLVEDRRRGPDRVLDPRTACRIVGEVGVALDTLHSLNLVHRDVKPSNVLIERVAGGDDVAWLADFGVIGSVDGRFGDFTRAGRLPGSGPYMAPERFRSTIDDIQIGFDVYALGAILYEVLTGSQAFGEAAGRSVREAHEDRSKRPLPGAVDESLEPFDAAVGNAVAVDTAERTASVKQFLDEMQAGLEEWERRAEERTAPVPPPDPSPVPVPPGPVPVPPAVVPPVPVPPAVVPPEQVRPEQVRPDPSRTTASRRGHVPARAPAGSALVVPAVGGAIALLAGLLVVSLLETDVIVSAVFVVCLTAFGVFLARALMRTGDG